MKTRLQELPFLLDETCIWLQCWTKKAPESKQAR